MPTKAEQEIGAIANQDYSGKVEQAFPYWALECVLIDQEPEHEELRNHVAVGDGDLGIDAYWIDETNRRLILLQAKYSARARRDEAVSFKGAIEALVDEDYVLAHANEVIREIYPELLEALIDPSYTIQAVLACGGAVAPGARRYASSANSQNWHFTVGGVNYIKQIQLEVLDINELSSRRDDLLRDIVEPFVVLPATAIDASPSFHFMGGDFLAVQATVPAKILIEAYDKYRSHIFEHNPRGPLGSNKVNKEIEQTLKDPLLKRHFHLLNNGLTSMCRAVVRNEPNQTLEITDFQVVNGCQTVFTLHNLRDYVTDDVQLNIRVVEGLHGPWADQISKASNYQTAVRPEQLVSLGGEHDLIQTKMGNLEPPWFYEKQKGYVRLLNAAGKRSHRQRYGNRTVSVSEVGQYGVAFLGYPSLAKYDLQRLFERPDDDSQGLYDLIFLKENEAEQLILPVLVGRRVARAVRERLVALKAEGEDAQELFSELNWLSFARMHITGLIGFQLAITGAQSGILSELIGASISRDRMVSIESWFDGMFRKAKDAVNFYIEVQRAAGVLLDRREFFRDVARYGLMADRVRRG